MRTAGDRLPPLISTRNCRCSRFVPELGFEIFRHDRIADRKTVAIDERISRREAGPLCASAATVFAGEYPVFLCRVLVGEIHSFSSRPAVSEIPPCTPS